MLPPSVPADLPAHGLDTAIVGREVRSFHLVESTQDIARAAGWQGTPEGLAVFADAQTAGRGRLGRRWQAPAGASLLVSVLLRPPARAAGSLTIVGSLAVCLAIEECTGLGCLLKWPNDVLIDTRKAAGLLAEGEMAGTEAGFVVLGIGINVNLEPDQLQGVAYPATSLSAQLGKSVSRLQLSVALLRHLDRLYLRACGGEPPVAEWRARLVTLGQHVLVETGAGTEEGLAEGVDETGALLLRRADGSLLSLLAGEVTLQAPFHR